MNGPFCAREAEVLDLVVIGQWPRQASDELVAHVTHCLSCTDLVSVAVAVHDGNDDVLDDGGVLALPDATTVWQRAQWQARQEAMRVASRPVVVAQAIAAIGILALIVVGAAWLMNLLPAREEVVGAAIERGSALFTAGAAIWSSATTGAGEPSSGLMWMLPVALGSLVVVVGLALVLSTLADFAADRPVR